ncbi:uncharacterized protein KQ657_004747 [Scheffersomyces spartinae]|uniref:Uncharacterized protein n=1 Tax=Scheffersomyces spartinae TaxID=45513 RepID=A0A9P7VAV4_9ASCO|nr:uncharacterized protein KQ657_004747 [Scheffersomyces spartinae]KAG7194532.1 hypothetical protein KQ657_004747 [Scheffersomyces spartinae]
MSGAGLMAFEDNNHTVDTSLDNDANKNKNRTPTSWEAEDDILLMHLKDNQKLGWKDIASHFNNRTPNACQFRWRRLKSGNLKNPPKSAAALGTSTNNLGKLVEQAKLKKVKDDSEEPKDKSHNNINGHNNDNEDDEDNDNNIRNDNHNNHNNNHDSSTSSKNRGSNYTAPSSSFNNGIGGFSYTPLSNATFTGYDNTIGNALAGLNALSNTPSSINSPMPNYSISSPGLVTGNDDGTTIADQDVSLDPLNQNASNAVAGANTGGGYYADISIDPTMNLPHNQPHPHPPNSLTPRNSTSHGNSASNTLPHSYRNNSIIQIVTSDRNSIFDPRTSVSSLPSKLMNIPHHQLSGSLAHLPLFGGTSISGPSRNPSISGPPGITQQPVASLRNGSVGSITSSSGPGYYSRSGSVVVPHNSDKPEDMKAETENELKPSSKENNEYNNINNNRDKDFGKEKEPKKALTPVIKIPWSVEEDELLINRRNRELLFAELSILLPQRTEGEIWARIDYLEKLKNGHRASTSREHRKRRQSSLGLEVDDFYDVVDDVISGIVSDDDHDDDDDVLVEVEGFGSNRRRRKRRASSAVNPLAMPDQLRRRIR